MAERTPPERNRYVDFLRAVSILVVITGHWLIAGFQYVDGAIVPGDILELQPRTQWLTWLFQVMPIFFMVGGYANAVSLESARRKQLAYADWLAGRLARLVSPLLVLLVGWAALSVVLNFSPLSETMIQTGSRAALIATWFLAIYIFIVVLAPLTYRAWQRWGFASFWGFTSLAVLVDVAFFVLDWRGLGWSNYLWVWLGVHQLGYAWRDGRLGSPARLLAYAAAALALLYMLVSQGPYPVAMAGSPDADISNSLPPKLALTLLGVFQFGVLLAIEAPMRRLLDGVRLWAATVLINSMIMTVYLWHLTVMIFVVALAWLAGGIGLGPAPGSGEWWLLRPLWIAVLYAFLLPATALLSRFERGAAPGAAAPPAWRQVTGAMMICVGIALLARFGFDGAIRPTLDTGAFLLVVAGSAMSGLLGGLTRKA